MQFTMKMHKREAEELVEIAVKLFGIFTDNFHNRINVALVRNRINIEFYGTYEELMELENTWLEV